MSGIGTKGFTLIEILAATAILAMGVVFVYQALLNCLDAYDYYESYFPVSSWIDEKVAQAQLALTTTGKYTGESSGIFLYKNREFSWDLICGQADKKDLFSIEGVIFRQGAKNKLSITRRNYALYNAKQ